MIALPAASSPDKSFPLKNSNHRIVVPGNGPLKFQRFGTQYDAHFSGRIAISGTAAYGCRIECQPPLKDEELGLTIVPDTASTERLPHWDGGGDLEIFISQGRSLIKAIATPNELAQLRSGKINSINKLVSVVVDNYVASIECDAPAYSARFVAITRMPGHGKIVTRGVGCG